MCNGYECTNSILQWLQFNLFSFQFQLERVSCLMLLNSMHAKQKQKEQENSTMPLISPQKMQKKYSCCFSLILPWCAKQYQWGLYHWQPYLPKTKLWSISDAETKYQNMFFLVGNFQYITVQWWIVHTSNRKILIVIHIPFQTYLLFK